MWKVLIDLLTFFIMPICGFFVIRNISNLETKIYSKRSILFLVILIIVNFLAYNVEYKSIITIINFFAMVICYKFIFEIDIFNSLIKSTILMILVFFSEIILYVFNIPDLYQWGSRNLGLSLFVINLTIAGFAIVLSKIPILKNITITLSGIVERHFRFKTIIIVILWISVISVLGYLIFKTSTNSIGFWIRIFIEGVFITFMVNYLVDKNKYVLLNGKFDVLYDYIQTMEDYLDNEQLNIHEYKNQLSVIKSMTSSKKIINYIDSLISDNNYSNLEWNDELKNLPKGGLKGLIYYKLAVAKSKNLNIVVNVSEECLNNFKRLSIEDIKSLSRLIGIYLDNAIEASELTVEKKLLLEIYIISDQFNFVISNSISKNVDLTNINRKGYSSKGKNRGRGLYLANKILTNNTKFISYTKQINDFFVQKLIIK